VRSHSASIVYDRELRPTMKLSLEAGPSYTEKTQTIDAYVGYVANVNVSKIFHSNRFTFYFGHRSGDSTGLGSVTDSNQGGTGFFAHTLEKRRRSISMPPPSPRIKLQLESTTPGA